MNTKTKHTILKILFVISLFIVFLVATFFMVICIDVVNGIYPAESKLRLTLGRMDHIRATWLIIRYYCASAIFVVGSIVGITLLIHSIFSQNKE